MPVALIRSQIWSSANVGKGRLTSITGYCTYIHENAVDCYSTECYGYNKIGAQLSQLSEALEITGEAKATD